jgi:hypothetical protein
MIFFQLGTARDNSSCVVAETWLGPSLTLTARPQRAAPLSPART